MKNWTAYAREGAFQPARWVADGQVLARSLEPLTHVHLLVRGTVELFHEQGEAGSLVFQIAVAPALLSAHEALGGATEHQASIRAVGDVVVHSIEVPMFLGLLSSNPELALEMLRGSSHSLSAAASFTRSAMVDTPTQLANLLIAYVELFGEEGPDGWRIQLRRSQSDFAVRIGASERSINRTLLEWSELGVMSKIRGRYVIHRLEYLLRLAESLQGSLVCRGPEAEPTLPPFTGRRGDWPL